MSETPSLPGGFLRQHLIDPELCIRCNTCEETCPINAITHDSRNYVVNPDICNGCMECIGPCPTGSIDNWRIVAKSASYSLDAQLSWDDLPGQEEIPAEVLEANKAAEAETATHQHHAPWSAVQAKSNLFDLHHPATATVAHNARVTDPDSPSDIHHIVLDFGPQSCPVAEGQTIGILTPGLSSDGKPHVMRAYSVANPRDGEHPGQGDVALTVKRVIEDHEGNHYRGVCTNYLCDLKVGDKVQVVGPHGTNFLMPNHPGSSLMMICTGTGVAPMRGMIEYRRRNGNAENGDMMLFYGGRTPGEIAYHDEFKTLPPEFVDINFAYSRVPDKPKQYVQDLIRVRADRVIALIRDENCFIYICGLKGMEDGIIEAFRDICRDHGLAWDALHPELISKARLHIETY